MGDTHDSSAGRNDDLDDTIERQIETTGLTGLMQTLRQDKAVEDIVAAETPTEDGDNEHKVVVLPPDALP